MINCDTFSVAPSMIRGNLKNVLFHWIKKVFFSFLSEILEYAEKIGIDLQNEPHLLYIAKEGVLQELPPQWKPW
jgi:hypothetical protein